MGKKNWFVKPEIVRLDLGDGEWIEIKKRLTVAEQRKLQTAGFNKISTPADGSEDTPSVDIDWSRMTLARVLTYLTEWSIRDDKDKPVRITEATIGTLDPDAFAEIDDAIEKHIEAMEEEKKQKPGGTKLKAM